MRTRELLLPASPRSLMKSQKERYDDDGMNILKGDVDGGCGLPTRKFQFFSQSSIHFLCISFFVLVLYYVLCW